jgi:hypothetical protein
MADLTGLGLVLEASPVGLARDAIAACIEAGHPGWAVARVLAGDPASLRSPAAQGGDAERGGTGWNALLYVSRKPAMSEPKLVPGPMRSRRGLDRVFVVPVS